MHIPFVRRKREFVLKKRDFVAKYGVLSDFIDLLIFLCYNFSMERNFLTYIPHDLKRGGESVYEAHRILIKAHSDGSGLHTLLLRHDGSGVFGGRERRTASKI